MLGFIFAFGMATVFSSIDQFNPNPRLACTHKIMKDTELLVAHRTIPCFTRIKICNVRTGLCTWARVKDRGPYGKWPNGNHKSEIDLSPAVQKKIKHNGFEPVFLYWRPQWKRMNS
jgi:rare lipoprotein A (peptidoglycan hydrolase)